MKIVINKCYGGFTLSGQAMQILGLEYDDGLDCDRADPALVAVVEKLGKAASGKYSRLVAIEIPDGVRYVITERDGWETVEEAHRSWS